jgi:hypothetical protein
LFQPSRIADFTVLSNLLQQSEIDWYHRLFDIAPAVENGLISRFFSNSHVSTTL